MLTPDILRPLVPTLKVTLTVELSTLFGAGVLRLEGPADTDGDGNPEVVVTLDAPGTALDIPPTPLEVPVDVLAGPMAGLVDTVLTLLRAKKLIP